MEEIFHHYTYAMSALHAPADFMWAAEIYFRDRRLIFLFGFGASSHIYYYQCLSFLPLSIPFNTNSEDHCKGGLWVCFHAPPSPTPIQGLKVPPHPSMLAVKGRSCCFGLCAPAPVHSGHLEPPSLTAHRVKRKQTHARYLAFEYPTRFSTRLNTVFTDLHVTKTVYHLT